MPTLHLMVGLPCSGKTTLAKQLEQQLPAQRLTPDEWIERLFGVNVASETLDATRDPMESLLWDVASKVLQLGGDVILDFGFWSRVERADFRTRASKLGAKCRVHFLDVAEPELLRRLRARNLLRTPGTFQIDEDRVIAWGKVFEAPDEEELRLNAAE